MPYAVYLKRSAEKELEGLPGKVHRKIIERLLSSQDNPRQPGSKKLWGGERYRVRVGEPTGEKGGMRLAFPPYELRALMLHQALKLVRR